LTNPSDRPPPYIPRWGQDPHQGEGRRLDPQHDPFGSDRPTHDEWGSLRGEPAHPSPRSRDPGTAQESPHQSARPHLRPRSRLSTILRYSFTFGLAAALTLALVYLLIQGPGSRDAQPTQNAGSAFTTRFKGDSEPQAKAGSALASADPAAAAVPRSPGLAARPPVAEVPAAKPVPPVASVAPVPNLAPPRATPPQPVETRPPAQPPRTLGREEIDFLYSQGEAFVRVGDFASARVVFRRAAEARDARAALALGATYDPILLARMGARGIAPDVAMAREWYNRARDYGSREAADRLQALATVR
jgi:hypothetical protein